MRYRNYKQATNTFVLAHVDNAYLNYSNNAQDDYIPKDTLLVDNSFGFRFKNRWVNVNPHVGGSAGYNSHCGFNA